MRTAGEVWIQTQVAIDTKKMRIYLLEKAFPLILSEIDDKIFKTAEDGKSETNFTIEDFNRKTVYDIVDYLQDKGYMAYVLSEREHTYILKIGWEGAK